MPPGSFQFMNVNNGVLCYEDGNEVCLWGINYYPAHSNNYINLKELGLDPKKIIDRDFEHFIRMSIDVIRVHLFDREISDRDGRLLDNEHLELTDYLIAKCRAAGIYFVITPIAWWNSMVLNKMADDRYAFWWMDNTWPSGFSNYYSKEAMLWDENALIAQETFLMSIAGHINIYTGKTYAEEPVICIWEIINEPCYRSYQEMKHGRKRISGVDFQWADERENRVFTGIFKAWLQENRLPDSEESYLRFRPEYVKNYIDRMKKALRGAGVRQPVAYCLDPGFFTDRKNPPDLLRAVADSRAEIITLSKYFGGDSLSQLDRMDGDDAVTYADLKDKAKIIYEYGDCCNLNNTVYPIAARLFRSRGIQIAAMFQYDPLPIAEYNTGWVIFYLNYLYTPQKTIGFMIAREVFHNLKRNELDSCSDNIQNFGSFAVSHADNVCIMAGDNMLMHSNFIPERYPSFDSSILTSGTYKIIGYGDSRYIKYNGKGIYHILIQEKIIKIEINPDAIFLREPWHRDSLRSYQNRYMDIRKTAPVARIENNTNILKINFPGWLNADAWRIEGKERIPVECRDMILKVQPGFYELKKIPPIEGSIKS